jgi:hypothetical protein
MTLPSIIQSLGSLVMLNLETRMVQASDVRNNGSLER